MILGKRGNKIKILTVQSVPSGINQVLDRYISLLALMNRPGRPDCSLMSKSLLD